ncbi:Transcriptional regulator, AcrR family [Olavius sp. associated proteobacterium Delta 1]|nr:Transcriptional regulator, AcrR family [Olavius sp. associated proteobacterium Delta 1]
MSTTRYKKKSKEFHEAISKLFARNGYHATSIRDIATELGINKSTLYHYIGSKEEALFNTINSGMEYAVDTLGKIAAKDILAEERLEEILSFYVRSFCSDPERILLLANEFKHLDKIHQVIVIEKQKQVLKFFKSTLNELASEKKLKDINPAVAIFAFIGMAHHTVNWFKMDGDVGLDELAADFVEIFTKGILK